MKYPIGIQSFDQIREEGYVYVDKTALVYDLAQNGKIYFLSRPRRFGKSLLISTLKHYFLGHKELFQGLAMEQLEKEWTVYPVFHLDFNGGNFMQHGSLRERIEAYLSNWEREYHIDNSSHDLGLRFSVVLQEAHKQTGQRAVVLIDEYDKPILDVLDSNASFTDKSGNRITLEDDHRNILKGFYSTFKAADADLRFVMLTGVTKFSQVSVFSGFNQPKDISMDKRYEALCGITQEELETVFAEPIRKLAEDMEFSVDEMKQMLKLQYDGYHFSPAMTDIYNPFSLLNAFDSRMLRDYWFASGTPTYLIRLLNHSNEQINELTGKYYDASMFIDYKADVERPLPMIYQSGYLTIKGCNLRTNRFLLDFPNNEVRKGFLSILAAGYLKSRDEGVNSWVGDAIELLDVGEIEPFCESLTAFLSSIPYDSHESLKDIKATEKHFQYTFYLLLRLLGVYCQAIKVEDRQSYGRVDCTLELKEYVYIFELKLDGSADEALHQIEQKGYAKPYATDPRQVIRIGMNFSSKTRTIAEWKTV
ncbi:MAG: ATP-binding protein [Mediterranea sp.]|nr:ATP-binding protein [Mediterranea sp.]